MEIESFLRNNFNDARKVYNICSALRLSLSDTRLYSYIFIKTTKENNTLDCFNNPSEIIIEALREMIEISGDIDGELTNRLKLYMDKPFRKEKLLFYINEILPKLRM